MATLKEKLDTALAEVDALKAEVVVAQETHKADATKWAKDVELVKSSRDYQLKLAEASKAELETLHIVFDSLPNSLKRKTDGEHSWEQKEIPAIARLCAYLATRN